MTGNGETSGIMTPFGARVSSHQGMSEHAGRCGPESALVERAEALPARARLRPGRQGLTADYFWDRAAVILSKPAAWTLSISDWV